MKHKLLVSLSALAALIPSLPAWASPVLWNYTKQPAKFTVRQYSPNPKNRGCETVTYGSGDCGPLRCESTCSVSIPRTGKIPAQKVYFTDGQRVTLDSYGLQIDDH
jgi:hypothetical protein